MLHLHQELDAGPDDIVEVAIDGPANVMLVDGANYEQYLRRGNFEYADGGRFTESSAELVPPYAGRWHLVVDLGGRAGSVHAGVRVLKGANV